MTHDLKSWPVYFAGLENGTKTFELRRNDRHFTVGDTLLLREFEPGAKTYTGREVTRMVTYIMRETDRAGDDWPLRHGYCALGIK